MPPARGVKKPKDDKSDHRVLANRYLVEKKLGSGNYGTAYLVHDNKANTNKGEEEWKVLKEISCSDLAPDETVDAMHEAKLLSKLHHPNIVRFNDSFLDGEFFCIITEYCEGGDLDDKITACKKSGRQFDQNLIMDWFVQLVLAVQHMHSRRVLHRDLKTRNIFLKNNMIKIGDFGISRVLMGTTDMASTFTGTPYYMSPEVLKHEGYNSKSDVWSIACILYELCSLQHAFEGQSLMGVMYKIVEGKIPEIPKKYDSNIQELLNIMLNRDPDKRPSATEVTKLPFVLRHMEKMKRRIVEMKEQREESREYIERDTQELATLLREKTHLEDLQDVSLREYPQQAPPHPQQHQGPTVQDPYKHLTPKERMRIRKMQLADEKAQVISAHARNNLVENIQRKEVLKGTIGTFNRPAWQGGRGEQHQPVHYGERSQGYSEGSFRGRLPATSPDTYYDDSGGMGDTVSNWEREDMGTVREVSYHSYDDRPVKPTVSPSAYTKEGPYQSYDDRPIKPAVSPNPYSEEGMSTLKAPSAGDNRPITPLKEKINLDDPNISLATPPGLKPLQKKKEPAKGKQTQSKPAPQKSAKGGKPSPLNTSQGVKPAKSPSSPVKKAPPMNPTKRAAPAKKELESPTKVLSRVAEAIPADADAAETYYSQHEDFESGSESGSDDDVGSDMDDDYDALMECMQSALDTDSGDQGATLKDNTLSPFSPAMRETKIRNLRVECERKIGKESFKNAYAFLKAARFGDRRSAGDTTMDEGEIMKGLKKFVKNPSDCFLIDQLLFLEEQASFDR
ncbi:serine/threonine-protein kinase Nek11-like isoform X2 [Acanthaster planci]|uniref:non-specific serine/threonine protein kinase n=1 Tax=Acanthaster planci TaxID=133434 RepID=A0A8B7ZP14_ACAPL|nr:serine/threonine-protein kinase Nek11-like isoform X2 [Acanthaster planci]